MKSFKSFGLVLFFVCLGFSRIIASGGEGHVITAWAKSDQMDRVKIAFLENPTVEKGSALKAEIQVNHPGIAQVSLQTREGRVVWDANMALDQDITTVKFHVGDLQEGVYFLKVVNGQGTAVQPVVVR